MFAPRNETTDPLAGKALLTASAHWVDPQLQNGLCPLCACWLAMDRPYMGGGCCCCIAGGPLRWPPMRQIRNVKFMASCAVLFIWRNCNGGCRVLRSMIWWTAYIACAGVPAPVPALAIRQVHQAVHCFFGVAKALAGFSVLPGNQPSFAIYLCSPHCRLSPIYPL